MKYDNKSDYAINKNTDDIVYRYADGTEKRYLKENGKVYQIVKDGKSTKTVELPSWEMTVEQFDWMKSVSDEDYHERELHTKRTTRENVTIGKLTETNCVADRSTEEEYFDNLDDPDAPPDIRTMENAMEIINVCLTEKQKRRYVQHHFCGISTVEIAVIEGVKQQSVSENLVAAQKKIKKYFLKSRKNTL